MRWLSKASKIAGTAAAICGVATFVLSHFFSGRAGTSGGTPPPGGSPTGTWPNINVQVHNSFVVPTPNEHASPAPITNGGTTVPPAPLPVNPEADDQPKAEPKRDLNPEPKREPKRDVNRESQPQPKPEPRPEPDPISSPNPPQLQVGRGGTVDLGGSAMTRSIFDRPRGGLLPGKELSNGAQVTVLELRSGWARIQWNNRGLQDGWIEQKLINPNDK